MKNIHLIFVEKFRSNYSHSSKWFFGKSSLGLEWIIPFLEKKGHIVDYINPNLIKINDIHKRSEYIINYINKLKKNNSMLVCSFNDTDITPLSLKKINIPKINLQVDSWNNQFCYQTINKYFDLQWLIYKPTKYQINLMKIKDINYLYMPWAGIPYYINLKNTDNRLLFYGSKNLSREFLLSNLYEQNHNIDVYGGNWEDKKIATSNNTLNYYNIFDQFYLFREPHYFKRSYAKFVKKLSRKKINYNYKKFHSFFGFIESNKRVETLSKYLIAIGSSFIGDTYLLKNPVKISKGRDWELPGMGIMLITHKDNVLQEVFTEGKDIEFYNNIDELDHKLKYYQENPSLALEIGNNARKSIEIENNFDVRFRQIYQSIS